MYLIKKFQELTAAQWLWIGIAAAVAVVCLVLILVLGHKRKKAAAEPAADKTALEKKDKRLFTTQALIQGGLCLALSFVLSYVKLFSMPMGGSITLCSMLPLFYFSNRYGWRAGLVAGLAYGLLQFIQKPEIYHWAQVILDYPLAFMMLGLAGTVKNLQLGSLIGGVGRMICHILSGWLFFGSWAPEGMNAFVYALAYNGAYWGVDLLICILLSIPLSVILKKNKIGG